jgi:tetratricopeptide (TPR) repeat protein
MTTNQPLSLFISSKMAELAEERRAVQSALSAYQMFGWLFEQDAGARPEPIQSTYLTEVEACDIYIGLFWQGYGQYTIEEYEQARALHKPCLVYEKQVGTDKRDPRVTSFLQYIQQVTDPQGLTVFRFSTVEALAAQVQKDVMHLLITTFRQSRQQPVQVWHVPFRRNPFFTGREELLTQLHENLTQTGAAALTQAQAISGLGGIGKTQTAVEYAYRYREEYQAILWVTAATQNTLLADFVTLAATLVLPEKNEQDQNLTVSAVQRWFAQHTNWLLILDNADDLDVVEEFVPAGGKGHILLTTRVHAPGALAQSVEVQQMDRDEGSLLLLRRTRMLAAAATLDQAPLQERSSADAIVSEMDGLPLALDQAGAYMEETQCGLAAYLERYRRHQGTLLQRRGQSRGEHPDPVASTWALSFAQVEQQNKASADLLRLCAFLAPDAIPEELISEGATQLGPQLESLAEDALLFDEAVGTLLRYSLVRRDRQDHTLAIHRLVQAVLKASLDETVQQLWAERAVKALNQTFPAVEYATWPQCKRLITQAQACADLLRAYHLSFPAAADLLNRAGWYLREHAQYRQAEPLLQQSISIYEGSSEAEATALASPLSNLGLLYRSQGKYDEALPLFQRVLAIDEQELGPMHPDTATSLNNLGLIYEGQGKYDEAEPLYKRALAIREQELGPMHPDTASSLNNLAGLYQSQGKYNEALPLYQRALAIYEQELGPMHPNTASSLNNLAALYYSQGKYSEAVPLYQRALAIYEQELGPLHPDTANSLNNLAALYQSQGKYSEAVPLYQRALAIREQELGPLHPDTANSLWWLATLYEEQRAYEQAEPLYRRAVAIYEQVLGSTHPNTENIRARYAALLQQMQQEGEQHR